jgi:ABC-type antimicrobial peptide transport system permease subunit
MAGSIQEFAIKAETLPLPAAQIGYWRVVWRRFKRHRVAYAGFFFFITLLFLVIAGPHMVPYELDQISLSERMQMPSAKHWLGTD